MTQAPRRSKRGGVQQPISAVSAHVGMRMKLRRRMLDLELDKLAQLLQISMDTLEKYEDGANAIDVATLFRVAGALEIPMQWFYDGLDPEIYAPLEQPGRSVESATQEVNDAIAGRTDKVLLATYFDGLGRADKAAVIQVARRLSDKTSSD
jgi:transcriptional regulator with XRE-family HTH domain